MIVLRLLLSIVIGLFAAALAWAVGMFIWGGYYPFWAGHEEYSGALMTRTMMTMVFFMSAAVGFVMLDDL